jgi:hypothetical protein
VLLVGHVTIDVVPDGSRPAVGELVQKPTIEHFVGEMQDVAVRCHRAVRVARQDML